MNQLEIELQSVREELTSMWSLVHSQLIKTLSALINFDKDLAHEVVSIEKRVNAAELKIDRDCEDVLALFSPVAVDLRFLLASLKINTNLERIADIAEGIAKFVINADYSFKPQLLEATKVIEMFSEAIKMLEETFNAFEKSNASSVRAVFKQDDFLDDINRNANDFAIDYLKNAPEDLDQTLYVVSIIRKLERVGDHVKNIAEEIIFYLEAMVLKHSKKAANGHD
jgi:phosphate transport system protein